MQTRPYPEKDGLRIWLSRSEQRALLEHDIENPLRRLAYQLGLHGLRSDEVVSVEPRHIRELSNGADGHVLVVPDGKTGKREVPVSPDLAQNIQQIKNIRGLRRDESLVDVSTRSVREWIRSAREELVDDDQLEEEGLALGMHDLRRTWATDGYYSLALAGVPIAEQLIMSWGGWRQTSTGRETFRENYLGPVPDHVTSRVVDDLELV